jgi:hypothetical protein
MGSIVTYWASGCLLVVIALALLADRIGRARTAAWLVVLGLFLLTTEEPLLTLWFALQAPSGDHDGMATLITEQARAHVLDASIFGAALFFLLGWLAMTSFRRGEPWARRVLSWAWLVAVATELGSMLLVFSRGLSLPGPGGEAGRSGFGWQPLAVALLAWLLGLRLSRPVELHVDERAVAAQKG